MNLHIMPDEKVISRTIQYFEESLPFQNRYVVITHNDSKKAKFVSECKDNTFIVKYGSSSFWKAVGDLSSYKNIIVHSLNGYAVDFINNIKHPNITWIAWGADLYNFFLEPKGYNLYYNKREINNLRFSQIPPYKRLFYGLVINLRCRKYQKTLKSISNICAAKSDAQLLLNYYPQIIKKNFWDFYYYPLNDVISPEVLEFRDAKLGNNIIVGNSASFTGNHEEVFLQLSTISLRERKVFVPLSYGNASVVQYICRKGKQLLNESFTPIMNFMPLDDYNSFLRGACTYIYGSYRQEAFGNIVVALYLGGSVFLHERNPLLQDFRNMGCVLFSTKELKEKIDYRLSLKEVETNRKLLMSAFSKERLFYLIKSNFG